MGTSVVLSSPNPYGSRTLTIETDRTSSVAYLRDAEGTIRAAVWLANHGPAPEELDRARIDAGLPPVMPRANTRHPDGTPPLDPAALSVLWFEEGDGVAVYQDGELLAVIPGWADVRHGIPGYARDAVGDSPVACPLDEALGELSARLARARAHWERQDTGWVSERLAVLGHLDRRAGPQGRYWEVGGGLPAIGVSERPPIPGRGFTVLSTVGMCFQRMPAAELYGAACRVELAVATTEDARAARWLLAWLGRYPWQSVTWLSPGHTARWPDGHRRFPLGGGHRGVVMLADPPGAPDLSGLTVCGDPVLWLWLLPLTEAELDVAVVRGAGALADRLAVPGRA